MKSAFATRAQAHKAAALADRRRTAEEFVADFRAFLDTQGYPLADMDADNILALWMIARGWGKR